jgi:serine/threonine protein kinase
MEEANPGHLNKRSSNHHLPNDIATRYLLGIDRGLRHMHSLGLVHNDVNPSNVMLSDEAIIIDFDSCLPVGSLLATAKRTPEWHDSRVWISTPGNDHRALQEMKI